MDNDDTTILHSSTDADFLATLPTLVGRAVSDSILVVPFAGKRTSGALRIDLPEMNAGDEVGDRLASVALGAMSRIDWCDTVLFAVYSDETFPVAFAGHDALVNALAERFHDAGFAVRDAFCVAADGWASWFDDEPPFAGRPLEEIDDSPLAAQAAQVRGGTDLAHYDAGSRLPDRDPATAALLTRAVDDLLYDGVERNAFGMPRAAQLPDSVDFVEKLLRREADDTPLPRLAELTALSLHRAHRDEMMLQMAFGKKVGRRARAENERLGAARSASGASMDEVVRAEYEAGPTRGLAELGDLILGECDTPPRPARIRRGMAILGRTIAHLPAELRPDLLCMLAWLHWALGASAVADAHISMALSIAPGHGMASILHTLVSTGKIPQWIFARYNAAGSALHDQRTAASETASV